MAAWRYQISLLVLKNIFSTLKEKFCIPARPCNILGLFCVFVCIVFKSWKGETLTYKYEQGLSLGKIAGG